MSAFLKHTVLFCLIISLVQATKAQQFVVNGSFDTISSCPVTLGQTGFANWTIPVNHNGSSDLFNLCGNAPNNIFADSIFPFNGDGYIGGYTMHTSSSLTTYREYVTDTLVAPLEAGQQYIVSFMYHVANKLQFTTDDLGFDLSDTMPESLIGSGTINPNPVSHNPSGNFLFDTAGWAQYIDTITAMGGEQFITIGAFDSIPAQLQIQTSGIAAAYFFYDSVSIVPLTGISVEDICLGEAALFSIDTGGVDSISWVFGDPATGPLDSSNALLPTHVYSDTGSFQITTIVVRDTVIDTLTVSIFVFPRQEVELGPSDTILCDSDTLIFDVSQPYATYLWHDGNTGPVDTASSTGMYAVTVFGVCDTVTDSIFVRVDSTINFTLGPDTQLCVGQVLELDAELTQPAIIEWTGLPTTVDSIFVNTSGTYEMSARNGCGTTIDDITVTFIPVPFAALPPDTLNCFDDEIILTRPDVDSLNFVWSDSTTGLTYTVDSTETVWLASFSDCGFAIDTINIVFNGEIYTELGEDTAICDEDSLLLNAFHPGATYQWSTNEQTDTLWATEDRLYRVTITAGACQKVESIDVELQNALCPEIDCELRFPNVLTANADGVNDVFRVESDCKFQEFTLRIYNRWGMLVHQSDNENIGWDGYVLGELAPSGTYFFTIDYKHNVVVAADFLDYLGSFTVLH